jgi:hypothetical protein
MVVRAFDDKLSDTLVVVSGEGFWTGSSTLPHLHHFFPVPDAKAVVFRCASAPHRLPAGQFLAARAGRSDRFGILDPTMFAFAG